MSFLRWSGAPDSHRFDIEEIARAIHEVDVLCVQEVFLSDAEAFFDRLTHPYKVRDPNRTSWWPVTFGGSGLGVASRFPLLDRQLRGFARPHLGSERFARKGMLYARLEIGPDLQLDVLTTHLQSGYAEAAARVRRRQLAQLRSFVDDVGSKDRAFVVCGDLNIDGLSASRARGEYAALREMLSDFVDLGADADHATFHPDPTVNALAHRFEATGPRQRIDYVLFRRPMRTARANGSAEIGSIRATELRPVECGLALHGPFIVENRGPTFASDHFALRVVFEEVAVDSMPGDP